MVTSQYLLDTNVLVELLRGRGAKARSRLEDAAGRLAVSSISVFELEYGAARSAYPSRNRAEMQSLLRLVDVLPFDEAAASHAGRIRASLAASGTPIGPYDTLLAGAAAAQGLAIVTANTGEFERVPGLVVENWL